ncbi:MAG: EamA family transporter [Melioribacteraceae bacterium]
MWLILAVLNPVSESFRSLFIKKASKDVDPLLISWANNVIPVLLFPIILLIAVSSFGLKLEFNSKFMIGFAGSVTIQIINSILYMRAIAKGDISTVMPMLSFTPLFLLIASPILIGEFPNAMGLAGIVLVVAGSYILNLDFKKMSFFAPIKAIYKNEGTRLMFFVSFFWGISGAFDKLAVSNSSVIQYITFLNVTIFIAITSLVFYQKKFNKVGMIAAKKNLFLVSAFTTGSFLFHYGAMALTLAAYVVSVKRLTGIFSVFIGYYFLNETNIRQRLLGATIMFIGVLFIVFA